MHPAIHKYFPVFELLFSEREHGDSTLRGQILFEPSQMGFSAFLADTDA